MAIQLIQLAISLINMKKSSPDVRLTQIWVSDMVLPLQKCIVIASNTNYAAVQLFCRLRLFATPWTTYSMNMFTTAAFIQEFILGQASHFRMHMWIVISTLYMETEASWNHPLYFDMFMTGYSTSPVWAQCTTTYSCLTSWSCCPRIGSFKRFQDSVMTKILSLLALSKKIIPHFSLQRLLFKLQGNIHHCQSGTSWL